MRAGDEASAHPLAVVVSAVELLGLGLPLHHGVHGLQVGGVGHQGQRDVAVCHAVDAPVVHPQVVLDVSRPLRRQQPGLLSLAHTHTRRSSYLISSFQFRVKLAENLLQLFSDHVS